MTDKHRLLNTRQAAELLGCSASLLNGMRRNAEGGPPYVRLTDAPNGRVAYRYSDLLAWVESRRVAS
jgi:predicted DNA-binding transcriptional regulator AlpA